MSKEIRLTPTPVEISKSWDIQVAGQSIPLTCGQPRVEVVSEQVARLVVEMHAGTAKAIAQWAELPVYPAEPEGAQHLAHAARALASAAHELACVLKERK